MSRDFGKDDAISLSLGLKKVEIKELKMELGLPENAEFCGYLVHIVKPDEFLAHYEETPQITKRAFSKTPDMALRFKTFSEAFKVARKSKNEIVVGMFDVGNQLLVFNIE
jgi:hypothetical protein